jgi:hypothetical protein
MPKYIDFYVWPLILRLFAPQISDIQTSPLPIVHHQILSFCASRHFKHGDPPNYVRVMSLLNNWAVLRILADVDFLAVLALTDTSASLHYFVLEQIISSKSLCNFFREHLCVLRHDNFKRSFLRRKGLFSNKEVVLLCRAVEAVRRRHDTLYTEVRCFLSPLLARLRWLPGLWQILEKPLAADFQIPVMLTKRRKQVPGIYKLEQIRHDYFLRLEMLDATHFFYLDRERFSFIHN